MRMSKRAVAVVVLSGANLVLQSGCQGCGMLLNLVLGVGVAVGGYYLSQELFN